LLQATREKAPAVHYWVVWMTPLGLAWWRFFRLGLQKSWLQKPWRASGLYLRQLRWRLDHAVNGDDDSGGAS
jgi:hypothetical protein